ncbi:MAG1140 family protein [Mycoplasmopsis columbinasalis]|uniref:Uncharacterized protein n=1 Tax=Mycoplasmopsis columbinasalis TaxID=114880 RepID=A0A449BA72_9BACT|nr:hypothetical protein [Mycoplasmopsis columbinasalis]VEU78075.1 Uncharacterised protein [Mycoplasmopsis columbinasalis]
MKKSTKLNKLVACWLIVVFFLLVGILAFLIFYQVNKTAPLKILVDDKKNFVVISNNDVAYLLKKDQTLSVLLNNEIYQVKIKNLFLKENLLYIDWYNFPKLQFLPNTEINATIILEKTTLLKQLIATI